MPPVAPPPPTLLSLPPELLHQIYHHLSTTYASNALTLTLSHHPSRYQPYTLSWRLSNPTLSVLLTCRRLYTLFHAFQFANGTSVDIQPILDVRGGTWLQEPIGHLSRSSTTTSIVTTAATTDDGDDDDNDAGDDDDEGEGEGGERRTISPPQRPSFDWGYFLRGNRMHADIPVPPEAFLKGVKRVTMGEKSVGKDVEVLLDAFEGLEVLEVVRDEFEGQFVLSRRVGERLCRDGGGNKGLGVGERVRVMPVVGVTEGVRGIRGWLDGRGVRVGEVSVEGV